MSKPSKTGLARVIAAGGYSATGLKAAFKYETAFRQELALILILAPLALCLGDNGVERALLIGSLLLVLIVELVNSAIESVVDRFGGGHHELSGRAKDIASAAVLIALINVFVVWLLVMIG
ncbi:MAG: diacylglycerol kinase [Thiotrichaceae bacterium]|nr:diacylglycerol kinase [Thiotrichaceae bacterium]